MSNNTEKILETPSSLELRIKLQEYVKRELLGPAGGEEEEVAETTMRGRYILGLLAPKGQTIEQEEQDSLAVDGEESAEEGTSEINNNPIASMLPNSMGLTFSVRKDSKIFRLHVRWGWYFHADSEHLVKKDGSPERIWKRKQIDVLSDPFEIKAGKFGPWSPSPDFNKVIVKGIVREFEDAFTITLYLINNQVEPKRNKDEAWVFQPELIVEHPENRSIFVKRQLPDGLMTNELEDRRIKMNYRKHLEFAVGHGVATQVTIPDGEWQFATRVETCVIPTQEVLRMEAPQKEEFPEMVDLELDMQKLAQLEKGQFSKALMPLISGYQSWIDDHELLLHENKITLDLLPFAQDGVDALEMCQENLERIRQGIILLDDDEMAALSFSFANKTMADQRVHTLYASSVRQGKQDNLDSFNIPRNTSWRPFQLAFLLLNIAGLLNPLDKTRSDSTNAIVDLLWFPTGGGKTEAYLGVAAFAMAIRRLQKTPDWPSGQAGVTVLMRYTLRLLTLQQFQRAATLMCACEMTRQANPELWGEEPFRIGLWVGEKSSPNWTKDAKEIMDTQRLGYNPSSIAGKGTPAQLTNCPWCGKPIDPGHDIEVELYPGGKGRTLQYCSDKYGSCPFSRRKAEGEGIPIVVVDEEIYRLLPALLIATVDKFAQMPWKGPTQMLFGRVSGKCPRHGYRSPDLEDADYHRQSNKYPPVRSVPIQNFRPPDLIIQDELHLISGPLGTLVGLYETAIDYLCEWKIGDKVVRPKVIASTATIKRASEQIHQLYLRKVNIFPPSGIDAEDNFFSKQMPSNENNPGRMYVGICAPGSRMKISLLRVYMAYMGAAQQLFEEYGVLADPWMTTVGYFNAMRELGGMRRVIDDSLRSNLRKLERRGLSNRYISPFSIDELNSRKSGADIPKVLDRLERQFKPEIKLRTEQQNQKENEPPSSFPLDIVLCTNMISVGVDVPRLGLMIVAGQPKTTAEYIQATSRVGRRYPGIVCTVYNWSRPRDLSHYERFEHYHDTFYQHVEALSITPFSARALDRGLTGTFVSAVRLAEKVFNAEESAKDFDKNAEYVKNINEVIKDRGEKVNRNTETGKLINAMLVERMDNWEKVKNQTEFKVTYRSKKQNSIQLLKDPQMNERSIFTCLNSLRDVEQGINLLLRIEDDEKKEEGNKNE